MEPLQHILFGTINSNAKSCNYIVALFFEAGWEFHEDDFIIIKFAIEKCTVKVKNTNVPVMLCHNCQDKLQQSELSNWGIGFVVVNTVLLLKTTCMLEFEQMMQ